MGGPMAGHLAASGHDVTVWNRTASKAAAPAEKGAKVAADLAELGQQCDLVFLCVNRSEDVAECLQTMRPRAGTLIVDHSTIAPSAAQAIHGKLAEERIRFVDAPITGGSMGAQKGQLTIFCGGAKADVDEAMPFMQCYAKRAQRVGESGSGQMMKMANQIAVGGALLALCECLSFCEKAGLDLRLAHQMIGGGAAGSWAFQNYGPKILERDWSPGFSVKNQRKDFAYCRDAADQVGAVIPGTDLVDRLLAEVPDVEWTTAALYDVLLQMGAGG
jgi:3-hydroxyisobutyrate dehydrogenase-like beta-hydroxyacid dehydrogenase